MRFEIVQRLASAGSDVRLILHGQAPVSCTIVDLTSDCMLVSTGGALAAYTYEAIVGIESLQSASSVAVGRQLISPSPGEEDSQVAASASAESSEPLTSRATRNLNAEMASVAAEANVRMQTAKLTAPKIVEPTFEFPDDAAAGLSETVHDLWHAMVESYRYASKVGETDVKFGRIQSIVQKAYSIVRYMPKSAHANQVHAYFRAKANDDGLTVQAYCWFAEASQDPVGYLNAAHVAAGAEMWAECEYALFNYFMLADSPDEQTWWYFVRLQVATHREVLLLEPLAAVCRRGELQNATLMTAALLSDGLLDDAFAELTRRSIEAGQVVTEQVNYAALERYQLQADLSLPRQLAAPKEPGAGQKPREDRSATEHRERTSSEAKDRYFERAADAHNRKQYDLAEKFYLLAIDSPDERNRAAKGLGNLYQQIGDHQRAVAVLEELLSTSNERQSIENILIASYLPLQRYEDARRLLQSKLDAAPRSKRVGLLIYLAPILVRLQRYQDAMHAWSEVFENDPTNLYAARSAASARYLGGDRDGAVRELQDLLTRTSDPESARLLEELTEASPRTLDLLVESGEFSFLLESSAARDLSELADFMLERAKYELLPADRQNVPQLERRDAKRLDEAARSLRTNQARVRADYYLLAARIEQLLPEDEQFGSDELANYLYRGFSSMGDAAAAVRRDGESVRELYAEALALYDSVDRRLGTEQNAMNALVRYAQSLAGVEYVDFNSQSRTVEETLSSLLKGERATDARSKRILRELARLTERSGFCKSHILEALWRDEHLREEALRYANYEDGQRSQRRTPSRASFARQWSQLEDRIRINRARIRDEFATLHFIDFSSDKIESAIGTLDSIGTLADLTLDRAYIGKVRGVLDLCMTLATEPTFEERERRCQQIEGRCDDLARQVDQDPTRLAVGEVLPFVSRISDLVQGHLRNLYASGSPNVEVALAIDSYLPNSAGEVDIQLHVSNSFGRGPAEAVEIRVSAAGQAEFEPLVDVIRLGRALRGGLDETVVLPIRVRPDALEARAFALPVYAAYSTRTGDSIESNLTHLAVRLYDDDEFSPVNPNPYFFGAEGGPVQEKAMFYGRDDLIEEIASSIAKAPPGKGILIFGQKRAGKSSVLFHLREAMISTDIVVPIDVGNIALLFGDDVDKVLVPLLWRILREMDSSVRRQISDEIPAEWKIPSRDSFFRDPSPVSLFTDVVDAFFGDRDPANVPWRLVLLIDEFSYIFDLIHRGRLDPAFMRTWKAVLQKRWFSSVLVGQDFITRYKLEYANEFGTTQDQRVSYLSREYALALLEEPIRIGGAGGESRYRGKAIERMLDLTGGSPFYIQILSSRVVEYINARRANFISSADVERVVADVLSGANALDESKFDNLFDSGDPKASNQSRAVVQDVLRQIARECRSIDSCAREAIQGDSMVVDAAVADLVNREVVEEVGEGRYRIRVGILSEWLLRHEPNPSSRAR